MEMQGKINNPSWQQSDKLTAGVSFQIDPFSISLLPQFPLRTKKCIADFEDLLISSEDARSQWVIYSKIFK